MGMGCLGPENWTEDALFLVDFLVIRISSLHCSGDIGNGQYLVHMERND